MNPLYLLILIPFLKTKKRKKTMLEKMKMRNDPAGAGHFGARRSGGKRTHNGLDLIVKKGEPVYAPEDVVVVRKSYPYPNDLKWEGIVLKGKNVEYKIFYLSPTVSSGQKIKKGQKIGEAQAISEKWGDPMLDHIHVETRNSKGELFNPETILKVQK